MRVFTTTLAVAGALWATGAPAQTLTVDEDTIHGCFLATETGASAGQCIGDAANVCQDLPGGSTTIGIADCLGAETAVWDKLLNDHYQHARDRMFKIGGADLQISLRDAQRAWIAFRDAECALEYDRWSGGTIRTVVFASCQMQMTARRAIALRDIGTGM